MPKTIPPAHKKCLYGLLVLEVIYAVFFTVFGKLHEEDAAFLRVFSVLSVGIMLVMGFGFLMTFLKNYGIGSVGLCYLLTALSMQSYLFFKFFVHLIFEGHEHIDFSMDVIVECMFAAAAVLITFGALIGRVSFAQLVVICTIEMVFYPLNVYICEHELHLADRGGSYLVHAYGSTFGLACSWMLSKKTTITLSEEKNGAVYVSDLFSYIGTVALWVFWPLFTGGLASDMGELSIIIVNTYTALLGSTVVVFAVSGLIRGHGGRFDNVDSVNATLAGGVAIGSICNGHYRPGISLIVGLVSGVLSNFGFARVSDYMDKKLGLKDVCGVLNLHCMPGYLGAIISVIFVLSKNNSIGNYMPDGEYTFFHQIICIPITFGIAVVAGFIAAYAAVAVHPLEQHMAFEDAHLFMKEDEEEEEKEALEDCNRLSSTGGGVEIPKQHTRKPDSLAECLREAEKKV